MEVIETTWRNFREEVINHLEAKKGTLLCRGQANSEWPLVTSFHRQNPRGMTFKTYFNDLIPILSDLIETLENRNIDIGDAVVNGSFLAYAQHHGFPTPLLDWTYSPYKAAYYAFSSIEDVEPQSEKVAIYVFDSQAWLKYDQFYDFNEANPHVSILSAKSKGNHRQISQQGSYFFTNILDIESHISAAEARDKIVLLKKYQFSVKEKPLVMSELELMGINAYSLFGGTEGMFRHIKEGVFNTDTIGETPKEKLERFLESLSTETENSGSLNSQNTETEKTGKPQT